jgi:hypothetical protein
VRRHCFSSRRDALARIAALAGLAALASYSSCAAASAAAPIAHGILAPTSRGGDGGQLIRAALAFVVTVCFDEVTYSSACRERSLMEAAQRLEQLFVDDYTTDQATGTLDIHFDLEVGSEEQLGFLRDAELRAIAAAAVRLQGAIDHPLTARQLRPWQDEATKEAREESNWQHNWSGRSHQYKAGRARKLLAGLADAARAQGSDGAPEISP